METSVNNECKAFTSLEQSKKLAVILPLESADMKILPFTEREYRIVPINDISVCGKEDEIYAWSLVALLSVLPRETRLLKSATDDIFYHADCPKGNVDEWLDNPVDACYELIIKLYELKML